VPRNAALAAFRGTLSIEEQALFSTRFERDQSLAQTARTLGWSEIRVRKLDTSLRTRLLDALQGAGFLQKARVRIGASLMLRRDPRKEG